MSEATWSAFSIGSCTYPVVKPFPEEIPDVHILTFEEELKYLALASEPLKSVAIIMLGQGMRPDEVFRMTYSNIDFINRTIFIVRGKTKNADVLCP